MGVATGCGCKEVYRFPHTTYPYSSCICSFYSSISLFVHFFILGVVVRRYIDFLILLIPTPLVSVLFTAASLLFVHILLLYIAKFRAIECTRKLASLTITTDTEL